MKRTAIANAFVYALLLMGCGVVQSQSSQTPLEQMKLAERSSKVSVPVDVRYSLRGTPQRNQSLGLELAFVARVAGQNLKVEFPREQSVSIASGAASFAQQKADPEGVVRRSLVVTPHTDQGAVRVLVSMDVAGTRSFGVFTIPLRAQR